MQEQISQQKMTWLKVIKADFYAIWPMVRTKTVSEYFPESEEIQKNHQQRRGMSELGTHCACAISQSFGYICQN